jgi:hypothetical protein
MTESRDTGARERLELLVGTWTTIAGPPGGPLWPGGGRVTFEWLEGGVPLLLSRSHVDVEGAPDSVSVIGCDGKSGAYYQLYTDERDVQRVYEMSLEGRVWKLWRYGPPFSQRFTGEFSDDGKQIDASWEIAEDGVTWRTDFVVSYTRVD